MEYLTCSGKTFKEVLLKILPEQQKTSDSWSSWSLMSDELAKTNDITRNITHKTLLQAYDSCNILLMHKKHLLSRSYELLFSLLNTLWSRPNMFCVIWSPVCPKCVLCASPTVLEAAHLRSHHSGHVLKPGGATVSVFGIWVSVGQIFLNPSKRIFVNTDTKFSKCFNGMTVNAASKALFCPEILLAASHLKVFGASRFISRVQEVKQQPTDTI